MGKKRRGRGRVHTRNRGKKRLSSRHMWRRTLRSVWSKATQTTGYTEMPP